MDLMTKEELFKTFYFESHDIIESSVDYTASIPLKPESVTIVSNVNFAYRADIDVGTSNRHHEGKLCAVTDKTCGTKFVVIPLLA